MSDQYQLIYASEVKGDSGASSQNLEISRILIHSKRYNSKNNINGALYCANGYFFQVLEGSRQSVLAVFEKIKSDQRHFNVRVLKEGFVKHAQFSHWAMHMVSDTHNIRRMLDDYQMAQFVPYQFNAQTLEQFVMVLSHDGQYGKPMFDVLSNVKKGLLFGLKRRRQSHRAA